MNLMHEVIVVGGGVIGLAVAREIAKDRSVLLLDRANVGEGTSWAAAGMLSPQSEADADGPFFQLSMASLKMYRRFAEDLRAETGIDPEYDELGLMVLASTQEEFQPLQARAAWQHLAGLPAEILSPDQVLALEPHITLPLIGALHFPGDPQVVPRKLVGALAESCRLRGVEIRTGVQVDEVMYAKGRVSGVRSEGEVFNGNAVVVCTGVWSDKLLGLSPGIPVHPRKGQILSLQSGGSAFRRMIRHGSTYIVPRRGGELVIGATNEAAGFDRSLTPGGIGRLLNEAQAMSSLISGYAIHEMWTGLRPATADGLPVIGTSHLEGLLYATGHYRNGVLLAPVTATVMAALVMGKAAPFALHDFRPDRFVQQAAKPAE